MSETALIPAPAMVTRPAGFVPRSPVVEGEIGVPVAGYPAWKERVMLVATNMARMDPIGFRDAYMPGAGPILEATHYPAVAPLRWAEGLNRSARAHSQDMATRNYFGHNTEGGETWAARIAQYWAGWALLGENIAGGFTDPLTVIVGLLADPYNGAPAPDGSGYDGHRWNIMYANYTHVGNGFAMSETAAYRRYYTQDFGRPLDVVPSRSPIASGCHTILNGAMYFLVNVEARPTSVVLVLDGEPFAMFAHLAGTWRTAISPPETPKRYHFKATDREGVTHRYPEFGEFTTDGGFNDSADYDRDGTVNPGDLFKFLSGWLRGDARADFHRVGSPQRGDVSDYVAQYMRGAS